MSKTIRLVSAVALIASLFAMTMSASAYHDGSGEYHPIANDRFQETWERTDRPVAETEVARTWIWGPGGFTEGLTEAYAEAEGGERQVQYFDKSRMEMPLTDEAAAAAEDSPWQITQGLLATELITGRLQLGDDTFEQYDPAAIPVAGDPDDTTGPTYAAMGQYLDWDPRTEGATITQFMGRGGQVDDLDHLASYGVTDAHYVEQTDHNVASVFWDFMNRDGTVSEGGEYVEDELFENPFYAVGYPITEAYWGWFEVDDQAQNVLVQCFERRCLTYAPDNPDGWQVESGNVGQHYYKWRYNIIADEDPQEPEGPQAAAGTFTTAEGESSATIDVDEEITLTANAVSAEDEPVEDAPVYFHILEDDEGVVSLEPDRARTDAEGNAQVTVTGESEGTAMVQAFVDMNDNGNYDLETDIGLGNVEVTVGEAGPAVPDVTLDTTGLDGLMAGETAEITASINNPDAEAGGIDHESVRFQIVVDAPVDCEADTAWEDWFRITGVNESDNTQGINDTFECNEDTGNFVGYWGPAAGFSLDAGADVTTTFDVEVQADAPVGAYTQTITLLDLEADTQLASVSGEFEIVENGDA